MPSAAAAVVVGVLLLLLLYLSLVLLFVLQLQDLQVPSEGAPTVWSVTAPLAMLSTAGGGRTHVTKHGQGQHRGREGGSLCGRGDKQENIQVTCSRGDKQENIQVTCSRGDKHKLYRLLCGREDKQDNNKIYINLLYVVLPRQVCFFFNKF